MDRGVALPDIVGGKKSSDKRLKLDREKNGDVELTNAMMAHPVLSGGMF